MHSTPDAKVAPVTLEGSCVRLEPLALRHAPGLAAAYAPGTMDHMGPGGHEPLDGASAEAHVREATEDVARCAFAVVDRRSGKVLGSTSYMRIALDVPRLEIGWTWYTPAARGTVVNPETKLLLLQHAFETLGCQAVWLRTSGFNLHSQAAIAKLGATRDGVIRRHLHQRDGRLRDTVLFSILAEAWPEVRTGLAARVHGLAPDWSPA